MKISAKVYSINTDKTIRKGLLLLNKFIETASGGRKKRRKKIEYISQGYEILNNYGGFMAKSILPASRSPGAKSEENNLKKPTGLEAIGLRQRKIFNLHILYLYKD